MLRILWKEWGLWVLIIFGVGVVFLIGRAGGEGTVFSFVVVLLKVEESWWEYFERGGVSFGR